MLHHTTKISFFFPLFLCLYLFSAGCPNTNTNPDGTTQSDGGDNDKTTQPLRCEKGTACLTIAHPDVRSCDILLKHSANIQNPRVSFGSDLIGLFKARGTRLAIAFTQTKDNGLGSETSNVLVQIDGDLAPLEITQATCNDRKGTKINDATVKIERP
jgi:hypothetical protein